MLPNTILTFNIQVLWSVFLSANYRYIVNTLICLPKNKINDIFDKFNSIHPNLVFTKENSINDSINFLDLNIKVENNKIVTNWYRKPILYGGYLNFYSNHNLANKIGIIYSLTDRAILLSHEKYHYENLNLVKGTVPSRDWKKAFFPDFFFSQKETSET